MVKRLKEKMNTLLQARKENKNKGFTLVELIVVIVILAILIGVTIGGIYGYVNKSRINTDINNASAITSTLSVLSTNKGVCKELAGKGDVSTRWSTQTKVADTAWTDGVDVTNTKAAIEKLLTDGCPAAKSDAHFDLTITVDADGNMTAVKCVANKGAVSEHSDKETALTAQE